MMPDPALDAIEGSLLTCSDARFRDAVAVLELKRGQPEIARILTLVRPRMTRLRPKRRYDLRRLLYLPVEDQLSDGEPASALGAITRRVMAAAWEAAKESSPNAAWLGWSKQVAVAPDHELTAILGPEIWSHAAELLVEHSAANKSGTEVDATELQQIAVLLKSGMSLQELMARLPPKPIRFLSPDQLDDIARFVKTWAAGEQQTAFLFLKAVMARMSVPATLIPSISPLPLGLTSEAQRNVMARLQQLSLAALVANGERMSEEGGTNLARRADGVIDLVAGIVAAKSGSGGADAERTLGQLRRSAGRIIESVVDEASVTARRGLDGGADATLAAREETETSLIALRKCRSLAAQIGQDDKVAGPLKEIIESASKRGVDLLSQFREDEAASGEASQEIYWVIRLLELAGKADEAERLWTGLTQVERNAAPAAQVS